MVVQSPHILVMSTGPGMDHRTSRLVRPFESDSSVVLVGAGRHGALTGIEELWSSTVFRFFLETQFSFTAPAVATVLVPGLDPDQDSIALAEAVERLAVSEEVDLEASAIIANSELCQRVKN